jgi:FtsH-binding integral membrane protein
MATYSEERGESSWEQKAFKAFFNPASTPLNGGIREHLGKVYATLALGCVALAVGIAASIRWHSLQGGWLGMLASFGSIFMLVATEKENVKARLAYFSSIAFFQGVSIGGLVEYALAVDPSLVLAAATTSVALFAGFSFAAFRAERRSFLYLGGICFTTLNWMMLASFINIFFKSQILWNFQLYGGLMVFSAFVVFDTQLMIEKFAAGDRDFIQHSLELFLDLVSLFVRILIILLKNREDEEKKERRKRSHR